MQNCVRRNNNSGIWTEPSRISLLHSAYQGLHPLSCDGVGGDLCKPPQANTIPYNGVGYIRYTLLLRLGLYKVGQFWLCLLEMALAACGSLFVSQLSHYTTSTLNGLLHIWSSPIIAWKQSKKLNFWTLFPVNRFLYSRQANIIIPAYRKHQHTDYSYKTVHTVYTATKPTTSMYCKYNSWHSSQRFIDSILSSTVTITWNSQHMKMVRLSAAHTGRLYPPGNIPGTHFC